MYNELYNFFSSPLIIRVNNSRCKRRVGSVARIGEMNSYEILVERLERKRTWDTYK